MLKSFHSDRVIHAECKKKKHTLDLAMLKFFLNDNSCLKRVLRLNIRVNNGNIGNNGILESSESETISFCFP